MRPFVAVPLSLFLTLVLTLSAAAETRSEYRAFWVDTFNTNLNSPADVAAVIDNAKAANANAVFVQVRRRGDSFYLDSLEPLPDGVPIVPGFDPLAHLIQVAHDPANNIEVHAFVIVGAIYSRHPRLTPINDPDRKHVFNQHGGHVPGTDTIAVGPDNWLTRSYTTLPRANAAFNGHRFGSDFWIDLGHPAAADYTHRVLMHLVANYDVDGVHLDRIRFPDFSFAGQTPTTGANIGYNQTSVERYQQSRGLPIDYSAPPAPGDASWAQWRRDQVTNFVRRFYLDAIAIKPQLKVSAALIVYGVAPATEAAWNSAEAYWRVYQDWRAWTQEGIIDLAMPMVYRREHSAAEAAHLTNWTNWLRTHRYDRAGLVGLGPYLNGIEGTLRQVRRVLGATEGVAFYSMATGDARFVPAPAVLPNQLGPNPFSLPAPAMTPVRGFRELASGLTTGKSLNGLTLYEEDQPGRPAIFAEAATIPPFAWKTAPTKGHLMGFARPTPTSVIDTGRVTVTNVSTGASRTTATDGNGFFGGVDLEPGTYHVQVELGTQVTEVCYATVAAGRVFSGDAVPDTVGPVVADLMPAPATLWPVNSKMVKVSLSYVAQDACPGPIDVEVSVSSNEDDGDGVPDYEVVNDHEVRLRAERSGSGTGRVYTIVVKAFDDAGNASTTTTTVTVPHDQRP